MGLFDKNSNVTWVLDIIIFLEINILYLRINSKLVLFLTTKITRESTYCDNSGKILNILKKLLHKPLIPIHIIIRIILLLFFKNNIPL